MSTPKQYGPEHERYTAALSYVWILCLYPLLFRKDSAFIQFHAKQGVALFVLEILPLVGSYIKKAKF